MIIGILADRDSNPESPDCKPEALLHDPVCSDSLLVTKMYAVLLGYSDAWWRSEAVCLSPCRQIDDKCKTHDMHSRDTSRIPHSILCAQSVRMQSEASSVISVASEGRGLFQGTVKAAMEAIPCLHIAASCFSKQLNCYSQKCVCMNLFLNALRFPRM